MHRAYERTALGRSPSSCIPQAPITLIGTRLHRFIYRVLPVCIGFGMGKGINRNMQATLVLMHIISRSF